MVVWAVKTVTNSQTGWVIDPGVDSVEGLSSVPLGEKGLRIIRPDNTLLLELKKRPDIQRLLISQAGMDYIPSERPLPRYDSEGVTALVQLPQLTKITIAESIDFNDDCLTVLARCATLVSMDIHDCRNYTAAGLQTLDRLPALRHLFIAGGRVLQEDDMEALARLANLETLGVFVDRQSSGHVKILAVNKHLRELSILSQAELTQVEKEQIASYFPDIEVYFGIWR